MEEEVSLQFSGNVRGVPWIASKQSTELPGNIKATFREVNIQKTFGEHSEKGLDHMEEEV
jgi:hypothetical protein